MVAGRVRPHFAVLRFTRSARHPALAQRRAGLPLAGLSAGAASMRASWVAFWAGKSLLPTRAIRKERIGSKSRPIYRTSQGKKPTAVRRRLRRLAQRRCQHCATHLRALEWAAHHVLETRFGGPHELWNLVALCHHCHTALHRGRADLQHIRDPRA